MFHGVDGRGARRVTDRLLRVIQTGELSFHRLRVSAWAVIVSSVLVEEHRHAAPLVVANWLLLLNDVEFLLDVALAVVG